MTGRTLQAAAPRRAAAGSSIVAAVGAIIALALACATPAAAQFYYEGFADTECGNAESMFRSGLEPVEASAVRASGAKGAAESGSLTLSVSVPDTGESRQFLLQVPAGYDSSQAWPLVVALHGAAGSPDNALVYAGDIRTLWSGIAESEGVLVLAPIAGGNNGGWVPWRDTPALACAIAQVERVYDIDRSRRYLWGFSAGGHYAHAIALANTDRFAAYAINAAALYALACKPPNQADSCDMLLPTVGRRIPVQLRVGSSDPYAPYVSGDATRLLTAGWAYPADLRALNFAGGHTVSSADAQWAWDWFAGRSLPP